MDVYKPVYPGLYYFDTFTFTTLGTSGHRGPDSTRVYANAPWREGDFSIIDGQQQWTVPATGTYRITAAGAYGAKPGRVVSGEVDLNEGQIVSLLVGQQPTPLTANVVDATTVGGGGGTFIGSNGNLLMVASGGDGTGGSAASFSPYGTGNGKNGGGYLSNGLATNSTFKFLTPAAYINGGFGSIFPTGVVPEEGGFGGGQSPVTSGISGGGGYTGSPGNGVSGATCYGAGTITDLGATSNTAGYVTVNFIKASKNKYSWTNRSTWSLSGIQMKNCKQVAWSSILGKFIAINVGNYPTVEISSDGYQWSEIQSNLPLMSNLYDITNIKDSIVLNSETGLWTSSDAINWKNTNSSSGEGRFTNTSSNVYFYSSNIYISSDGYTWSMYPINVSGISRISYGNNIFVGVGFTTPYVYVSNNSVDWILALEGTNLVTSNSIGFSNGNFIVSGDNSVSYSPVTDNIVIVAPSELYSFQNVTFTTGGVTGNYGPTLTQARNGLIGVPSPSTWSSTYLQMNSYQGIQQWTVPKTGYYTITCAGGGGGDYNYSLTGGYGAVITILYKLTKGQVVSIVCGQRGGFTSGASLGGFGGSFVFISSQLLVASGGGAGTVSASSAANASLTTKGNNAVGASPGQGGVGPNGGYGSGGSPAGTNGQPGIAGDGGSTSVDEATTGSGGGGGWSSTSSFLGGNGGTGAFGVGDVGGFGLGGGTAIRNTQTLTLRQGAGGGGGYGGGGACSYFLTGTYSGGGGGSYFITSPISSSINNNGPGYVRIEFLPAVDSVPWSNTNIGDTFTKIKTLNNTVVGINNSNVWYSTNGTSWDKSKKTFSSVQNTIATSPSLGYSVMVDGQYSYLTIDGKYIVNSVTNSGGFQQAAWSRQLGLYVGTGTGLVSVSKDAKTWESVKIPLLSGTSAIEWSPELGIFLIYCYGNVFISNDGYSWSRYPGPNQTLSNGHKSIVWAPSLGIFTIRGRAISKDGINWQVNGGSEIRPIAWSPKLARFTTGKYYSNDGLNWTTISNAPNTTSVTWSPKLNIFVAVDEISNCYTSYDGITWKANALQTSNRKTFISIAQVSSPYIMISNDGKTWYTDTSIPSGTWTSITFANDTFVAVCTSWLYMNGWVYTGTPKIIVSKDAGSSWITNTFSTTYGYGWLSVTYGNNTFMTVGDTVSVIISSDNGITWVRKTIPSATWLSVAYGNGVFIVCSYGDTCAVSDDNGTTWTIKSMPGGYWKSIAYGNGVFIAVNNTGAILARTTSNGTTWTGTNPNPNLVYTPWNSVIYENGLFVAVGTNYIMTSNDTGLNWIYYNKPGNWISVTYGNGIFTAVSSDNITSSVITSSDGINWILQPNTPYGYWSGVAYGEQVLPEKYTVPVITWSDELQCFVLIGTKRSYTYVFTSKDGISFTNEGNFQTFNQPLTSLINSDNTFLLANGSSFFVSDPIVT